MSQQLPDPEWINVYSGREIQKIVGEPFELGRFQIGNRLAEFLPGERSAAKPQKIALILAPHPPVRENGY